jgi:hypothetical protein
MDCASVHGNRDKICSVAAKFIANALFDRGVDTEHYCGQGCGDGQGAEGEEEALFTVAQGAQAESDEEFCGHQRFCPLGDACNRSFTVAARLV